MGFKNVRVFGRRRAVAGPLWEPEEKSTGAPTGKWLGTERYTGDRDLSESAGRRADGP